VNIRIPVEIGDFLPGVIVTVGFLGSTSKVAFMRVRLDFVVAKKFCSLASFGDDILKIEEVFMGLKPCSDPVPVFV
jgi:hypothetical protein